MNADLTFNTIAFKKSFDEKDGSERRSSTRGYNTPDLLVIKHQDSIDSATKVATRRHLIRIDRVNLDATTGQTYTTSFLCQVLVPVLATSTDVSNVIATGKAVVADADMLANVLNNES